MYLHGTFSTIEVQDLSSFFIFISERSIHDHSRSDPKNIYSPLKIQDTYQPRWTSIIIAKDERSIEIHLS